MKLKKYNMDGADIGELEVSDAVFNIDAKKEVIYELIKKENNNERQGNASTKGRGDAAGGGEKPWRQKGTGRARQGTIRATQWVGGGRPFGPKPRELKKELPQKKRQAAYRAIFSLKAHQGSLRVIDEIKVAEPKTRLVAQLLKNLKAKGTVTLLLDEDDRNLKLALRNLQGVRYLNVARLRGKELFYNKEIIGSEKAIRKLEEMFQ